MENRTTVVFEGNGNIVRNLQNVTDNVTENGQLNGQLNKNQIIENQLNNDVDNQSNGQLNGQLNESQKETLEYIRTHEGCNTTMISNGLGKPFRTIDKHIQFMIDTKIIERRGSKKTGGYYVV